MNERIKIHSVSKTDGNDLKGCYFKQRTDGDFDFHDKDDRVIAQKIAVGSSFQFKLDEFPDTTWTLSVSAAPVFLINGTWSDRKDPAEADGTYQAQAGGGVDVEDKASAAYGSASNA